MGAPTTGPPVDQYIGGIEHAILHLLYFRFYHKLLRDCGFVDSDEPAINLLCQGMVVAETFYREDAQGRKEWINPADVEMQRDDKGRVIGAVLKADGQPVSIGGIEKMAKSKNNGVDPQINDRQVRRRHGAPVLDVRGAAGPVAGMERGRRRGHVALPQAALARTACACFAASMIIGECATRILGEGRDGPRRALDAAQKTLRRQIHETINKVSDDFGRRHAFNTAIAALMELLNAVTKFDDMSDQGRAVRHEAFEAIVLLLNPITPHICHALWQALGHGETLIEDQPWPQADAAALVRDTVTLAVQVNGKLRGTIEVAASASKEDCERAALAEPSVVPHVEGQSIRKVVVVPGKIVNIVV